MQISLHHHIKTAKQTLGFEIEAHLPIENTIVGIFGKSGAGKSTILKIMAGLEKSARYEFSWQEQAVNSAIGRHNPCVYVGEDTPLFEHLSVKQNLDTVAKHAQRNKLLQNQSNHKLTYTDIIALCKIDSLLQHQVGQLSSGEKQRVNFARALLSTKPILLLDEAFSALDWQTRAYMQSVLMTLVSHYSYHCVMVSHSLRELGIVCGYLWQIADAKLIAKGNTQQILSDVVNQNTEDTHGYFSILNARFVEQEQTDNNLQVWELENAETPKTPIYVKSHVAEGMPDLTQLCTPSDSRDLTDSPHPYREFSKAAVQKAVPTSLSMQSLDKQSFIINADAVSITTETPVQSSMLNQLPARICHIHKTQHGVLLSLLVTDMFDELSHQTQEKAPVNTEVADTFNGCESQSEDTKQVIRSLITLKSFTSLNLQVGDNVHAIFKALDKQVRD